jgi:hypothetical protein
MACDYKDMSCSSQIYLQDQVKQWPTPAARDVAGISGSGRQARKGYPTDTLPNAVHVSQGKSWSTPTANEDAAGTPDGKMQWMLTQAAKSGCATRKEYQQWQTPTAMEGADCGSKWEALAKLDKGGRIQRQMATRQTPETQTTERAQLNPDWVEWLMGWPIGWTRLESIELDERGWETDPADGCEPSHTINTPTRSDYRGRGPNSSQQGLPDQVKRKMGGGTGDIPRVATDIKARTDRLKAIGNGQVPQAAELAWRILTQ